MSALVPAARTAEDVTAVAEDLSGEYALRPLLERILLRCTELLQCDAGSVASVDEAAGTYRKEADIGIRCQSGQVFPLSEGMTGAVVARRAPVWFARYDDVRGGHVLAEDRARLRGVIGVPLEWRGEIVGVCVVFSRDDRRVFGPADAELLGLFAKHAAVALANARLREVYDTLNQGMVGVLGRLTLAEHALGRGGRDDALALVSAAASEARQALVETRRTMLGLMPAALDASGLEVALADEVEWARRAGGLDVRFVTAGEPAAIEPALAHEVLRVAQEALTNVVQHAQAHAVRVGIAYHAEGVALLVQDDGRGFDPHALDAPTGFGLRRMTERAHSVGGRVELDSLPGWGTCLRLRMPYTLAAPTAARATRVVVLDPEPVVRAGLIGLLGGAGGALDVVAEAATVEQALAALRSARPDVLLSGLRLGEGEIADAAALSTLLDGRQTVATLFLAGPDDDDLVVEAMRRGGHGCLDRSIDASGLTHAVLAAGRGQAVLSGAALQRVHRGLRGDGASSLTRREREVRALVETGLTDKAIAARLSISVKTVEKHVSALLRKAGAHNRTELVSRHR